MISLDAENENDRFLFTHLRSTLLDVICFVSEMSDKKKKRIFFESKMKFHIFQA